MSDIFDDVEKLLAEEAQMHSVTSEATPEEEVVFNDSELKDIMAEIESLEGENNLEDSKSVEESFATLESPVGHHNPLELVLDSSKKEMTDLQKTIDAEIAQMSVAQEIKPDPVMHNPDFIKPQSFVEPIVEKSESALAPSATSKREMSFSASGMMNVKFDFMLGEHPAQIFFDPAKGLVVSFQGFEISLNEVEGCKVFSESGFQMTIPLTNNVAEFKKKAA